MREQRSEGGTLQQRIGAMGNMESHPTSLAPPFHPKKQAKSCPRRTCYPTLQRGFVLMPTYGVGIGGEMAQEASFISAVLSSLTPANPTASLGRKPVGCRGSPPSPMSPHLSAHTGAERRHLRWREEKLCPQTTPCPPAQCSYWCSSSVAG